MELNVLRSHLVFTAKVSMTVLQTIHILVTPKSAVINFTCLYNTNV